MLPSEFVAKAEELGLKWEKEHRFRDGLLIKGAHGYASQHFTIKSLALCTEEELLKALNNIKKDDEYQYDYEHLEGPANEPL